ncbi:MAG TPA: enoyl-CoA hydratase/isomerase family protein [Candidatus Dormibacteraeota bacterium]|jgi:enoyl-CoA hydratase/carnithine racemase|nr:enoyl-CoA hydratase/isomerase family protein [Candidatus Dormibacteraeota bacterium]
MELTDALYEAGADGVATITLNRPEQRNPLGPQMLRDLASALGAARDDAAVRAVVLTGAGDRAFCAGADLSSFAADAGELERHDGRGLFVELFIACEKLGKPLIGCINGHALAGGFGLALCCDLVVASDQATFGTPEIRVGVWPMMIMSIVTRNLGRKRAMELFMTGARIDAATAMQWGIVNRVVPYDQVREDAHAWAAEIAAWSPLVMRLGRDAFYAIDSLDYETALRYLQAQLTVLSMSEDFREGVTAFLEKRAPQFRGR